NPSGDRPQPLPRPRSPRVRDTPEVDGAVVATRRSEPPAAGAEAQPGDPISVCRDSHQDLPLGDVPERDGTTPPGGGEHLAVRAERHTTGFGVVTLQGSDGLFRSDVPQLDRLARAGRREGLAVWAERDRPDGVIVVVPPP